MVMVSSSNLVSFPEREKALFGEYLAKFNGILIWDGKNSYFVKEGFAFMFQGKF